LILLFFWTYWDCSTLQDPVFRFRILAGFCRVLRRFVLLRLDGIDFVLFGVELPVRITMVVLSSGMAGLLHW